jgi:hypothetical protein
LISPARCEHLLPVAALRPLSTRLTTIGRCESVSRFVERDIPAVSAQAQRFSQEVSKRIACMHLSHMSLKQGKPEFVVGRMLGQTWAACTHMHAHARLTLPCRDLLAVRCSDLAWNIFAHRICLHGSCNAFTGSCCSDQGLSRVTVLVKSALYHFLLYLPRL